MKYKDTDRLKVNGWVKKYYANTNHEEAGVAILISAREDFKTRKKFYNIRRVDSSR